MPRGPRTATADYCYHVLSRGNARAAVFHEPADYDAFLELVAAAQKRVPMRVLGYCLMPNHFHLVVRPRNDGGLSSWMQWLMTSHVRRYRKHHGNTGHVWEGRYKAFRCQDDDHLLTVLRYVERNALRAGLVGRAQDWPHGSLFARVHAAGPIDLESVELPPLAEWVQLVNEALSAADLAAMRKCVERGSPYGAESWTATTAKRLGLQSSLRPRGRPRKHDG